MIAPANLILGHSHGCHITILFFHLKKKMILVCFVLFFQEKERLSQSDFSTLLNNDTFHRSLLACSAEIVLVTYNISCE